MDFQARDTITSHASLCVTLLIWYWLWASFPGCIPTGGQADTIFPRGSVKENVQVAFLKTCLLKQTSEGDFWRQSGFQGHASWYRERGRQSVLGGCSGHAVCRNSVFISSMTWIVPLFSQSTICLLLQFYPPVSAPWFSGRKALLLAGRPMRVSLSLAGAHHQPSGTMEVGFVTCLVPKVNEPQQGRSPVPATPRMTPQPLCRSTTNCVTLFHIEPLEACQSPGNWQVLNKSFWILSEHNPLP